MAGDARPWGRSLLLCSVTTPGHLETELGLGSVVAKPRPCQAVEDLQGLHLHWELLLQAKGWKPELDPCPVAGQTLLAVPALEVTILPPCQAPRGPMQPPWGSSAEAKVPLGH